MLSVLRRVQHTRLRQRMRADGLIVHQRPDGVRFTPHQRSCTGQADAHPSLTKVRTENDWYELVWSDGYTGRYPYIWLRDNCRCSACYYPSANQRLVETAKLDADIVPVKEELIDGGKQFTVTWPDGHSSVFCSTWLHRHRFDQANYDPIKKLTPKGWGAEMIHTLPKFDYQMVMEDSTTLRDWLRSLVISGIAVLTGAPTEMGVISSIATRVGYGKTTMYGSTFQVEATASSSNVAYTPNNLPLHVDLTHMEYSPSVQMLHCIKQCETIGGESKFCDAMKVSQDLKRTRPDLYKILTSVPIDSRGRGTDYIPFHFQFTRPVITLNGDGSFKFLSHNSPLRAPYQNMPVEGVKKFYESLIHFDKMLHDRENFIAFKLAEGDVATFNNNRVMHGRSSFRLARVEEEGKKTRHLEGGYVDWDVIYSRLRLLDEEMEATPIL